MSMIESVKTSAEWLALWSAVETQISTEYSTMIGVTSAENGNDRLELQNRITELEKLAERYKREYQKAYKSENNGKKTNRLTTYNNGL